MSMNKKAIETLFDDQDNLQEIMSDTIYLTVESLDEDATFEDAIEECMRRFNIIASEYVATELFGYDFETYYDSHDQELTADILQFKIDGHEDGEEAFTKIVAERLELCPTQYRFIHTKD